MHTRLGTFLYLRSAAAHTTFRNRQPLKQLQQNVNNTIDKNKQNVSRVRVRTARIDQSVQNYIL